MSREEDLEAIDISIDEAKAKIQRKEALERLQQNPDFKTIIDDGFLNSHAIRQVMLKAHPQMQEEKAQNMLNRQITAIGELKQFFIAIYSEGMNAANAISQDEATREELLQEDLIDG